MERKDFNFETKEVREDGSFTGYLAVFGNVDSYGDVIKPGAFSKSLGDFRKKKRSIPILWQHNPDKPIGGFTTATEDDNGLLVDGKLLVGKVQQASEAHALLDARVISGMSIGFETIRDKPRPEGGRELLQVNLWEGSIVTFPANELARVDAIKSALISGKIPDLKTFERFLRDAGFSRTQATTIASRGMSYLLQSDSDSAGEQISEALATLKTITL